MLVKGAHAIPGDFVSSKFDQRYAPDVSMLYHITLHLCIASIYKNTPPAIILISMQLMDFFPTSTMAVSDSALK